jgi:hypothetical protein
MEEAASKLLVADELRADLRGYLKTGMRAASPPE